MTMLEFFKTAPKTLIAIQIARIINTVIIDYDYNSGMKEEEIIVNAKTRMPLLLAMVQDQLDDVFDQKELQDQEALKILLLARVLRKNKKKNEEECV